MATDWQDYKQICDQPWVWSRWMLEQTIGLLKTEQQQGLQDQLADAVNSQPLAKPADHTGDQRTDMFELRLGYAAVQTILQTVKRQADEQRVQGYVAAWQEYLDHLAGAE